MGQKVKKPGNGFKFAIAQAIIYTVIALTFLGLCIYFAATIPKSFTDYMVIYRGKGVHGGDNYNDEVKGALDDYYKSYRDVSFLYDLIIDDEPYIEVDLKYKVDNDGDGVYTDSEARLIKAAISDKALVAPTIAKSKLRGAVLKSILIETLKISGENDEEQ